MAKTHWAALGPGIWPTPADDDDADTRAASESKPRYHALSIRAGRRRSLRLLLRSRVVQRLAYAVLILVGLQFFLHHSEYRQALAEKYTQTLFSRLSQQEEDLLASSRWRVGQGDQHAERQGLLREREQWKKLSTGYEGSTFTYNGSVIKVFDPDRSPLRICVPGVSPKMQWPPELPVSLLLGGLREPQDQEPTASAQRDFVPIVDYFFLPTPGGRHVGEWHLVTPFLKSGTLEHLAKRLQRQDHPSTPDELDARFRPSFNQLLRALDTMHSEHELCHDDIKWDNILITRQTASPDMTANSSLALSDDEEAHWLIADLGNARQLTHAYHSSLLWTHDNHQHVDCRVNDVIRLVKSYMFFLQAASGSRDSAFNELFLSAAAPWSRLYWYTINYSRQVLDGTAIAQQVLEISSSAFPPSSTTGNDLLPQTEAGSGHDKAQDDDVHRFSTPSLKVTWHERLWPGLDHTARKALMVRRELKSGMSVSEKWAKIFGTMGIFPKPYKGC